MTPPAGAVGALVLVAALSTPSFAETVPEPEAYRIEAYRAPVPATLEGARVIDTAEAKRLWDEGEAVFVDVLPRPELPKNLPEGTVWRDRPRDDIPGSVWLPNTGYGVLTSEAEGYLREGLARASNSDPDAPLVIYCQANCWMSWNAAKRAMEMGHTSVFWYPEGTDGWAAAGHDLERREPE